MVVVLIIISEEVEAEFFPLLLSSLLIVVPFSSNMLGVNVTLNPAESSARWMISSTLFASPDDGGLTTTIGHSMDLWNE